MGSPGLGSSAAGISCRIGLVTVTTGPARASSPAFLEALLLRGNEENYPLPGAEELCQVLTGLGLTGQRVECPSELGREEARAGAGVFRDVGKQTPTFQASPPCSCETLNQRSSSPPPETNQFLYFL